MATPAITVSGRCSRCLAFVDSSAGCTRCWSRTPSEAATAVLALQETVLPELITAVVLEEQIPVFQSLLRPPDL